MKRIFWTEWDARYSSHNSPLEPTSTDQHQSSLSDTLSDLIYKNNLFEDGSTDEGTIESEFIPSEDKTFESYVSNQGTQYDLPHKNSSLKMNPEFTFIANVGGTNYKPVGKRVVPILTENQDADLFSGLDS